MSRRLLRKDRNRNYDSLEKHVHWAKKAAQNVLSCIIHEHQKEAVRSKFGRVAPCRTERVVTRCSSYRLLVWPWNSFSYVMKHALCTRWGDLVWGWCSSDCYEHASFRSWVTQSILFLKNNTGSPPCGMLPKYFLIESMVSFIDLLTATIHFVGKLGFEVCARKVCSAPLVSGNSTWRCLHQLQIPSTAVFTLKVLFQLPVQYPTTSTGDPISAIVNNRCAFRVSCLCWKGNRVHFDYFCGTK